MDEYAFSYVNEQSNANVESLEPPSPRLSPALAPILPTARAGPPRATVRSRATSIPDIRRSKSIRSIESPNLEGLVDCAVPSDKEQWYIEAIDGQVYSDEDESDVEDDLADLELLALRDSNVAHLASCRQLLDRATTVLSTLQEIKSGFDLVSAQTSTLQTSCSELQTEEARLTALADGVKDALQPFSYLATANRLLNVPGSSLVLQANYQEMLVKIQSSLDFLKRHQNYRDAEVYTRQYRLAMTKALTLARVYFASTMREISADITARTQINAMNKNTQSALLYTKFRSVVNHVRPLMRNMEDASIKHTEYSSLLSDCWNLYFSIRKSLVSSMISHAFKELANITDFVTFCTAAISFMRVFALDEKELFFSFFQLGYSDFMAYITSIGQYFTDAIRPRIAVESSLSTLCEICGSMQAQCVAYSEDQDTVIFDMTPILATTLGEIQTRIVFKAQGVIINEIQGYKPTAKDLDYPNCLKRRRNTGSQVTLRPQQSSLSNDENTSVLKNSLETPQSSMSGSAANGSGDLESLNSVVIFERWYITLRVSISLLSKIYKLVQSRMFDDLAHEVVRSCIASLLHASNLIKQRNIIDGHLFLLKHLLVLKEQISAFDIEHNEEEEEGAGGLNMSTVTGAFWDLTTGSATELFAPTALYNLASSTLSRLAAAGYLSRKVENMSDAREELDDQTRLVIGTLTLYCADSVTVPLRSAMGNKVQSPKDLLESNRKFRAGVPDSFSHWREAFALYASSDDREVAVLLGIIQDKVLETYERFDSYVRDLRRHKAVDREPFDLELPTLIDTVDWLSGITGASPVHTATATDAS